MNQPDLFPVTAKATFAVRAMALSDPQWQSIEPKRELVFPVGEPAGNDDRKWRFTADDLAMVEADFAMRKEPAPVLYRHGDDPARGGMAAGWIDKVECAPDGLYAFIRYTERALSEVKDGGWGFRSPGFDAEQDADGYWHPRKLTEVSLVNDPAIAGMPPIRAQTVAAAVPPAEPTEAASEDAPTTPRGAQEEQSMGDSKTVTAAKKQTTAAFDKAGLLGLLRETYAMPEAVSDEMLVKMLMEALAGAPEQPEDMAPEAEQAPPVADPIPAAASVKKPAISLDPETEVKAQAARQSRAAAVIQSAARLGRITPATMEAAAKLALHDPDAFETVVLSQAAPAAGQLITHKASDRHAKAETYADKVRAARFAGMRQ